LLIAGSYIGLFRILEWAALDQFFQLRPQEGVDQRIVIVTINETDIQHVKQWPMADAVMAQIIKNIQAQQPRVIGIDIYRDLPVEPGYQELVKVFENSPNLFGVQKVAGNQIAPSPILAEHGQVAANDLFIDHDGKIRRGTVLLKKDDGSNILGLGVKMALSYLQGENIELEAINQKQQIYGLGKAKFVPLSKHDGEYNQEDMGGYQILINYQGGLEHFLHISMTDVLENRIPEDLMRDRIVLLGPIAPSLNDNYLTPANNTLFTNKELVPGVVIHSNIASQILRAAISGRPLLRAIPKYFNWGLIFVWAVIGSSISLFYLRRAWLTITSLLITAITIVIVSYLSFLSGWLVPLFTPLLALVTAAVISIGNVLWLNLILSYRKLEQSEKRFRTLVENIPGAIYRCQFDADWTMDFISATITDISGYPASDFIYNQVRTYASIIHSEDVELVQKIINQAISNQNFYTIEYRIINHKGEIRWVSEQGRGIFDHEDRLVSLDGAIFDISDRKRAQEALRIAEENYRSIFENALEGIFQSSLDGHYLKVNPAMARIYSYDSPEEMIASISDIGKQIHLNPQDREEFKRRLLEEGQVKDGEYKAYRKDGSIIWVEEDSRIVKDSHGEILYFEGIIQDITERKLKEQEIQRQLAELKIEIDEQKRAEELAKITESDYFQDLQAEIEEYQVDTFWDS
jgi:PAS domain S-box-containing protein